MPGASGTYLRRASTDRFPSYSGSTFDGFVCDCKKGLELWRLGLFVDDGSLHIGEARFFQHGFEFHFAEAQPLVGVELAGLFEAVLGQVEEDNAATGGENAEGLFDGAIGVQGVMERLREEDEVDFSVGDGDFFHVAEAEVDVFYAMAECLVAADFDHLCGCVDGNYLLCPLR